MENLFAKLCIITNLHNLHLIGSNYGYIIRNLFLEDKIKLVEAKYLDDWKNSFYDIIEDLKKENTWCTYDRCVDVKFTVISNIIQVHVTIWDGDNMEGWRKNKRWEASFSEFPKEELMEFQSSINWQFDEIADILYEKELESAVQFRINQIKEQLLTNSYGLYKSISLE